MHRVIAFSVSKVLHLINYQHPDMRSSDPGHTIDELTDIVALLVIVVQVICSNQPVDASKEGRAQSSDRAISRTIQLQIRDLAPNKLPPLCSRCTIACG